MENTAGKDRSIHVGVTRHLTQVSLFASVACKGAKLKYKQTKKHPIHKPESHKTHHVAGTLQIN